MQAKSAERTYNEAPDRYSDYSNVKTGKILSYIGLALSLITLALAILYFGVIIALISSAGGWENL